MKRTALSCSVGVFLLLAGQLLADIPKQLNYQGILSGSTGNPLADSTVDVEFRIYNTPAGGSSVWAETVTVTTDGEGRFNVTLGLISPIEDTVFGGTERYLSINVESSGEIVPRTKLTSVGYANRVSTVDGSSGGGIIGHTTIYGTGLDDVIALGVSDPNVALELRSGTTGGSPYMDFANDPVSDFDARIQQNGEKGLKVLTDSSFTVPFGKVGIGTTSPTQKLHVAGNARVDDTVFTSNVSSLSPLRLQTAGTTRIYVDDATGNVGIGNVNPTSGKLVVQGGNLVVARPELGNQPSLNVVPGYAGNTGVAIVAAGNLAATHLYLQPSNGNVGIGTTNPTNPLQMASGAHVTAGGTWTNASSRELKTDIEPLKQEEYQAILDKLKDLEVVHFKYKSEPELNHIGMIAEDVPGEISSPDRKGIPTADAIAFLMAAVKAQQEKITKLETILKEIEKN